MLHYIIQTIAFQLFFLIIYDLFLKKETFFNWNRTYLLTTACLSLVIPFVKISSFKHIISQDYIISLPEIFIGSANQKDINPTQLSPIIMNDKSFWTWEFIIYLGIGITTILFVYKLINLLRLLNNSPKQKIGNLLIVSLIKSNTAFSFFNYVFLGEDLKKDEKEAVLKHEMVHVKQKHTLDLLFFELLRILFWFNPLVYMYQNRIMSLHEFIADAQAVKNESKNQYYQNLLSQVFQTKNISFINPFFKKSLIKKRIIMLQKSKSKQVRLFKYALLIPLVFGMLIYSSCEKENRITPKDVLDLGQYSYSLNVEEKEMSASNEEIHNKYEAFLKSNPNYVAWAIFDNETKTASYSVHNVNEKLPDGFESEPWEVNSPDGESYKMYVNYKSIPETEESKKQKAEELLKLKEEFKNALDVPFSVIDQVPVFPGCEDMNNDEQRDCMSRNISMHVNRNFNTEFATALNLKGRQRINVIFKIDTNGNIVDVRSKAPHPALEAEAIRVIKTLPKFTPGEHKGKKVNVPYSLPIIFQVQE